MQSAAAPVFSRLDRASIGSGAADSRGCCQSLIRLAWHLYGVQTALEMAVILANKKAPTGGAGTCGSRGVEAY